MSYDNDRSEIGLAVVSLWAEDVAEALCFYRDAIGLELISAPHERPHFRLGETYLVILQGKPAAAQNAVPERFPILA